MDSGTRLKISLAVAMTASGMNLDSFIGSLPKGSTPNKYKPHVGQKQINKGLKSLKEKI